MNYKEFLHVLAIDITNSLMKDGFTKNMAINKIEAFFNDPNNDEDIRLIFLKIKTQINNVEYKPIKK